MPVLKNSTNAKRSGGLAIAWTSFRRECRNGIGYGAWWFFMRFYLRFVKSRHSRFTAVNAADEQRPITVVVPAVEKDAPVLAQCLRSIRDMIRHQLAEIWVVAPDSETIRSLAAAENCKFVHEDSILPQPAKELKCRGWVLQQFIKLNASSFVSTPDYLVVDADTVFLRPQSFFRNGRAVLRYADQYELLYNRSLELVFGHSRRFPVSFVTHHMLFNAATVKELLRLMEQRFGKPWWEAILQEVDKGHPISFSEYELYAHFALSQPGWKDRFHLEYWRGLDRYTENFGDLEAIRKTAAGQLNTVSFHWHTQ
jgi:hypothetical protein